MIRFVFLLTTVFLLSSHATLSEASSLPYSRYPAYEKMRPMNYLKFRKRFYDGVPTNDVDPQIVRLKDEGLNNYSEELKEEPLKFNYFNSSDVDNHIRTKKRSSKYQELYEKFFALGMKYAEIMVILDPLHQYKDKR